VSTSEHTPTALPALPAVVELSGRIAADLADHIQRKIAVVLGHTGRVALHAHVRVVRHEDPARDRPVTARASVQLAGVTVHAHADAATALEAADLLLDRLDHRIARVSRTRRGDRCAPPPTPAAHTPVAHTPTVDVPDTDAPDTDDSDAAAGTAPPAAD
jgi:ribosome-associated translation inhibitor RaiA